MSKVSTGSPLRQRMIEDMTARKLGPYSQRSHIYSCKRFAAFLKRSPDTATADDIRRFQLHLVEAGHSLGNRNRIMTGVKFLFRVTLRRHDLVAEMFGNRPEQSPAIPKHHDTKIVLEIPIREVPEDREIDAVFSKPTRILGQSERSKPLFDRPHCATCPVGFYACSPQHHRAKL